VSLSNAAARGYAILQLHATHAAQARNNIAAGGPNAKLSASLKRLNVQLKPPWKREDEDGAACGSCNLAPNVEKQRAVLLLPLDWLSSQGCLGASAGR
jgi:hypothetical protein